MSWHKDVFKEQNINKDELLFRILMATIKMRKLQKQYFKTRALKVLQESKLSEKEVDDLLDILENKQIKLL